MIARALLCALLLVLLGGCEKKYGCVGPRDQLIENRPGEIGAPLCQTSDGRHYDAQEARP